jgi:hypothetical protein
VRCALGLVQATGVDQVDHPVRRVIEAGRQGFGTIRGVLKHVAVLPAKDQPSS